jgi:hypothetical protein
MKLLLPLLALSLVANAVLALGPWRQRAPTQPPGRAPTRSAESPAKAQASASRSDVAEVRAAISAHPSLASAISSRNPKQLLAALREAGFPDRIARVMVFAEAQEADMTEIVAAFRRQAEAPFWRLGEEQFRIQEAFREVGQKSRERLREAFDGKVPADLYGFGQDLSRYRFLPAEKAAAVARIDADYFAMAIESRSDQPGPGRNDPGVLKLLDQERRADLAQILTPAELELHDLHLSSAAESLRQNLVGFQPTEAEFRAMYAVRRSIDEASGRPVGLPGMGFISWASNENEKYRAALSPERFAEFQRAQDGTYRAAQEIVRHFRLAPEAANQAYDLQRAYQGMMQDRAATGTPEARRALAQKAREDFAKVLGSQGAQAYFSTAGRWIGSLERSAPPEGLVRLPGG